jgi:acetyltransferase
MPAGDSAEFAIVIGDCWQRRGLGEGLLNSLIATAAEAGLQTLTGITLSTNLPMLRLAKKLGFALRYEPGDATLMRLSLTINGVRIKPGSEVSIPGNCAMRMLTLAECLL